MLCFIQYVRTVLVLESGVELEWKKKQEQWDAAVAAAGAALPTECLGRGCRDVAVSPWHSNRTAKSTPAGRSTGTQLRWFPFVAIGAKRRRRCSAAHRLMDSCSVLARVCFVLVFQSRGHKTLCAVFLKTPHHILPNVTAGASGIFWSTFFFWRRQNSKVAFARICFIR